MLRRIVEVNWWLAAAIGAAIALAAVVAVNRVGEEARAQGEGAGAAGFTLSVGQLRINQRISQAAVRRSNESLELLDPLRGDMPAGWGTGQIADDAVTGAEIADDAVGSGEIADDAVGSAQIADDAVGSGEIADGAVGGGEVADGALSGADIGDGTVTGADIADNTLGAADLDAGSVRTGEIANGEVRAADVGATIVRTDVFTVPVGNGGVFVNCLPGELRLSGGALLPAGNNRGLQSSFPNGVNGWTSIIRNNTAASISVTAYVLCLRA